MNVGPRSTSELILCFTICVDSATGHNIPTFPLFRAYLAWLSQGSSNMHSISFKRWALRHSSVQDSLMNKPSFLFVNRSVENDHVEETEKFKNSFEQMVNWGVSRFLYLHTGISINGVLFSLFLGLLTI